MTHHPRPPLFGSGIDEGFGPSLSHAEKVDRITRGLGGMTEPLAKSLEAAAEQRKPLERYPVTNPHLPDGYAKRIEDATLEDALERPRAFGDKIGAGKTAHLAEFARNRNARMWAQAAQCGYEIIGHDHHAIFAPPARVVSIVGPGVEQ